MSLSEVNRTAFGVARIRAAETRRADALFSDPYAEVLSAGSAPRPAASEAEQEQRRRLVAHVILRTRWYDDALAAAGNAQVVVLGAGLDARAWRLSWPAGTVLWELDQPAVLDHKRGRLDEPAVDRRAVAVDLRDDWPASLRAAGHEPDRPTTWLAEGLLVYLEPPAAQGILASVTELSAPGSVVLCEARSTTHRLAGTVTELWQGGPEGGAARALADLGWTVEVAEADEVAAAYGRPELATGAAFTAARR